MAFEIEIESSSGAPMLYHRLVSAMLNFKATISSATVASFYTKEARNANKGCLGSEEFSFNYEAFPLTADHRAELADLLGVAGSQVLENLRVTFDNTSNKVHLAGHVSVGETTFEMLKSVEKGQMPFDLAAILYPLIAEKGTFMEADEV